MRILLVEDDQDLVSFLKPQLQRKGYAVETSSDGIDAEFMASEEIFDGIILDLGLPKQPGLEVLHNLREKHIETPILILTARDSWQEKVDGLKQGADDYLTKPFHFEELQARLEAILRRSQGKADNQLICAGIVLDVDKQLVTLPTGRSIDLTGKEFRLLRYLMSRPDTFISKSVLSEHVYEEEQLKDSNVIEVYINRLRQYLGKELIVTKRGQGYLIRSSLDEV